MDGRASVRAAHAADLSRLLAAAALFCATGCYNSLGEGPVACRVGEPRNCPGGYECRAPADSTFGQCCKPTDLLCGAVDAADTTRDATLPGSPEVLDASTTKLDGAAQGTGGLMATGGLAGQAGSDGRTGGMTAATGGGLGVGGVSMRGGVQGQGGGIGTGGVQGTGGAQGSGGAQGTGGPVGTGGAPGTGGTTAIVGTGGSIVSPNTLVTSAVGAYWQTGTWTEVGSGTAAVTVNDGSPAQLWEGFGGAFSERGWSYLTTQALRDEAVALLFGTDGAHFAWGRIPIGASDYAMDRYTDDETANDTTMASFSISRDREKLMPYVKAAQAAKPNLKLWASPWTPPTWMKDSPYVTPGNPVNAFDGGSMKNDATTLNAYALYLIKWIQAYAQEGINIEVLAPQNQPGYAQNYPSCLWDAATYVSFLKILGPALTAAGLNPRVMLGTMSNPGDGGRNDLDIATAVMADATAKDIVKVFGAQWGVLDRVIGGTTVGGLPVWATEIKCGNYPWNPSGYPKYVEPAPNDQAYAVESWGYIRDAIKNGKVTSFNAWNMVLDKMGKGIDNTRSWSQNALLVVDGGAIIRTPAYYVFRHFSQFVEPGATVVGTTGGDAVAFKNPDGSLVAVMYAQSAASNYVVRIGGKLLQFSMPADGWATIRYK